MRWPVGPLRIRDVTRGCWWHGTPSRKQCTTIEQTLQVRITASRSVLTGVRSPVSELAARSVLVPRPNAGSLRTFRLAVRLIGFAWRAPAAQDRFAFRLKRAPGWPIILCADLWVSRALKGDRRAQQTICQRTFNKNC